MLASGTNREYYEHRRDRAFVPSGTDYKSILRSKVCNNGVHKIRMPPLGAQQ